MDVWHENQALSVHDFDSRHRAVRLMAAKAVQSGFLPDCGRPFMACKDTLSFSEYP